MPVSVRQSINAFRRGFDEGVQGTDPALVYIQQKIDTSTCSFSFWYEPSSFCCSSTVDRPWGTCSNSSSVVRQDFCTTVCLVMLGSNTCSAACERNTWSVPGSNTAQSAIFLFSERFRFFSPVNNNNSYFFFFFKAIVLKIRKTARYAGLFLNYQHKMFLFYPSWSVSSLLGRKFLTGAPALWSQVSLALETLNPLEQHHH